MKVTLQAVRIYGSQSRYGSHPRLDPLGRPIMLEHYPNGADGQLHRSLIYLGAPVESVMQAAHIRMAIGHILLEWLTGNTPQAGPDKAIEETLEQVEDPLQSAWDWYTTIIIEREIEVDDDLVNTSKYVWLDGKAVYQYEDSFKVFASPYIDRIAAYVGTILDSTVLQTVVLTDRVFCTAPHRMPFGLPRSSMSGRGTVAKRFDDRQVGLLERRLRASAMLSDQQQEWLDDVKHWYLAALGEEDVWKQFFWFYLCLEILSEQLAPCVYDRTMNALGIKSGDPCPPGSSPLLDALCNNKGRIASHKDLFLRGKFAVVTQSLFPETADVEFAAFERLKTARNSLAHGDPFDVTNLPITAARDLTQRYLNAAMADQLSGNY